MARLLYLCVNKDKDLFLKLRNRSFDFLGEIQPKDVEVNEEIIFNSDNSLTVLVNPTRAVKVFNKNALIGLCYTEDKNEWLKMGKIPDGNFVIKREEDNTVEVVTDYQATKSLWYYFDNNKLIVSSSQRMIIHLLGIFELNEQAVMWMLSSGTLGYKNSWDKRIKSVPPACILKLNRDSWRIDLRISPVVFEPNNLSLKENIKEFNEIVDKVFSHIDLKDINPILSITGGYDSRAVFLHLKKYYPNLDLITFGDKDSIKIKHSDLYCAKAIANKCGLKWTLFDTNINIDDYDGYFTQMLQLGEGRIDLLERITDNFFWIKSLFSNGYDVLFNGMEGFSCQYPYDNVKLNLLLRKLYLLEDFHNVDINLNINQQYHEDLKKNDSESYNQHYYKINQLFFNPYGDSALNEIQNCYFDVINPLLAKSIIEFIRKLPDRQRVGKKIQRKWVREIDKSNVPFAGCVSVIDTRDILKIRNIAEYINNYLIENNDIFPQKDIRSLNQQTKLDLVDNHQDLRKKNINNIKGNIKEFFFDEFPLLARKLREYKHLHQEFILDPHLLRYRMFIVVKMTNQLENDANHGKQS
ncbi:MAG: hypothetical protein RBS58_00075 [Syntrophales bacterium]|jgi:asparagine synthetase B (glutamine-hydrolysing)|nr:hypothetical protein [Syntrophales bacterium]MDX9921044.1 hypothetical protein [Syntrophales bacterium]